jgi:hypothetical protein
MMITGMPGSGKSNLILNLILNSNFDNIIIKNHKTSKEFSQIDYIKLEKFEDLDEILDNLIDEKNLVIFEDTNKLPTKESQYKPIEELFAYRCSHNGNAAIIIGQSPYSIPTQIRKLIEIYYVFGGSESFVYSLPILKEHKQHIVYLLKQCKCKHDFVKIDLVLKRYWFNNDEIKL